MDKKSSYTGISKSQLRSLNKNYVGEFIKDDNKIIELISVFIQGELESINLVLESNEILNFKDSTGETLIHAILKNESSNINEDDKLDIIKKLVNKNVSFNSMNQLNQNSLHIACLKGYINIIKYLIDQGCDQTLIDNNGNAPVNYLIDNFIITCKQNDFYDNKNYNIQKIKSGSIKKINDIIKNQTLNIFIELFKEKKITDDTTKSTKSYFALKEYKDIFYTIKELIKSTTQNMLPNIDDFIQDKIIQINKIFINPEESNENKFEKAKNIIFNCREEIKSFYSINLDENQIDWDNFIDNLTLLNKNNKKELIDKINIKID